MWCSFQGLLQPISKIGQLPLGGNGVLEGTASASNRSLPGFQQSWNDILVGDWESADWASGQFSGRGTTPKEKLSVAFYLIEGGCLLGGNTGRAQFWAQCFLIFF